MGKTHRREPYPSKEERRQADAVAPKKRRMKTPDEVWAEYETQQKQIAELISIKTQEEIMENQNANATPAAPAATPAPAVNTVTPVASAPVATAPAQAPAPATTPAPHWSTCVSNETCMLMKRYLYKATVVKKLSFEESDQLADIIQKKQPAFNSEKEFADYINGLICELEKIEEAKKPVDVINNNSNNNGGTTMENNNVNPAPVAPVATATAVPTEVPTAAPVKLSDFDTAAKAILIAGGVIIIGLVAYAIINGVMTHRRLSALEAANGSM